MLHELIGQMLLKLTNNNSKIHSTTQCIYMPNSTRMCVICLYNCHWSNYTDTSVDDIMTDNKVAIQWPLCQECWFQVRISCHVPTMAWLDDTHPLMTLWLAMVWQYSGPCACMWMPQKGGITRWHTSVGNTCQLITATMQTLNAPTYIISSWLTVGSTFLPLLM
jgi:hypothetical protein